jgi:hypothetical protein
MLQGDWEEGVGYLRKAAVFHNEIGLIAQVMWAKPDEIEFFINQGQVYNGLVLVASALSDSEELPPIRSLALRQRANLLALRNADPSAIDAAYRAAIECARSQAAKYYELEATIHFGRWLKSQERAAEARTMLTDIYNWFTEGFDTLALKEAKAVLDELSGKPDAVRQSVRFR